MNVTNCKSITKEISFEWSHHRGAVRGGPSHVSRVLKMINYDSR